ncbi:MAG: DUF6261 family protein [Bacteroidia bacterium]|nr:DUF6261 family protein [Bacteroidia bacterium]
MKKLAKVSVSQLAVLEIINMADEIVVNANDAETGVKSEDEAANRYLLEVDDAKKALDVATKNVTSDPYTQEVRAADKKRDVAISAYRRQLRVYEYDADAQKVQAFFRLDALWKTHKDLTSLNDKAQTSGIENFLLDSGQEPYRTDNTQLALVPFLENIQTANAGFKTVVGRQDAGKSVKVHYDNKALRKSLEKAITNYSQYILAMANAYPDRDDFDKLLSLLNVTRKKYGELVTRRRKKGDKPEEEPTE